VEKKSEVGGDQILFRSHPYIAAIPYKIRSLAGFRLTPTHGTLGWLLSSSEV
jgi:hypothetical protein